MSILLRQSIDIGIDDTFKAGIDIEYWRYFWKISITTLIITVTVLLLHAMDYRRPLPGLLKDGSYTKPVGPTWSPEGPNIDV